MLRFLNTTMMALFVAITTIAQINIGGEPESFRNSNFIKPLEHIQVPALDLDFVRSQDKVRVQGSFEASARKVSVNVGLNNSGTWTVLASGDRVWRAFIEAQGALATELFFDEYQLPEGATLYIHDPAGEQLLGGFTNANNQVSGRFATDLILGPSCILEYYEPAAVAGEGILHVSSLGYSYKQVHAPAMAKADDCEVDVACSESNGWGDQVSSVVRLRTVDGNLIGWCTGSVVNNTAQDCTPFVLTAMHCGETASNADFQDWKFYFNYQRPSCGFGPATAGQVITGSFHRADSNDGGGTSGSDFLLVEIDTDIPTNYAPFYAGWDASGVGSNSGVCVHQPNGDEKKISTYTNNILTISLPGSVGAYWRVVWSATVNGHGVTEEGSSGSPLFNDQKHIIGTLTAGESYCNSVVPGGQNQPDYFGKMSYHWDDNSNPTDDLKEFLDPTNSGATTLDGSFDPCNAAIGIEENDFSNLELYPNPSTGSFNISLANDQRMEKVEVFNAIGALVLSEAMSADLLVTIDLSNFENGTYHIQVEGENGQRFSKPLLLLK